MTHKIVCPAICFMLLMTSPMAFAKTISGKVEAVTLISRSIVLSKIDPVKKVAIPVEIEISPIVEFTGVDSLEQISAGDSLIVDFDETVSSERLQALKVTKV